MTAVANGRAGIAGAIARAFIGSKLTPLLIIVSVLLGIGAAIGLAREEEPQIKVPMVDVLVAMPGATAAEVERRVTSPLERLLWEIDGVEYVYSTSQAGRATAIVRFRVGEDVERSLVKLHQKLIGNADKVPPGASAPLIKARSIDDVPVLALTFHSATYDHEALRRVAAEVEARIKRAADVAETKLIGGLRRQLRVRLDPVALAARGLGLADSLTAALAANHQATVGAFTARDQDILVEAGGFFTDAADVGGTVVGVHAGAPVHLRDVAAIEDAAEDPAQYVLFGRGGAVTRSPREEPAVTLSIAKRPGTNAIVVVGAVRAELDRLRGTVIPRDVEVAITRNYGETSSEKSNELLLHMAVAILGVTLLVLVMLGWRESLVVAVAIPSTLALTLFVFYLVGYTLNRITLFALIFSIGILVDDAIVVVENIVRHRDLPEHRGRPLRSIAIQAVAEVGNPTILATLAVIAAIVPMAFVGGLMGPYMRPIPIGATAAMAFSLVIAFVVTPWAASRLLRGGAHQATPANETALTRGYRWLMSRLVGRAGWRLGFFAVIGSLLAGAIALVPYGGVHVKMLPFDNKSELDIVINMPEDSSLERTAAAARDIAAAARGEPEITDYQVYVGTASPFTFNGLVRHYDQRQGSAVADVQLNLLPKHERRAQSHDIAVRIRPAVVAAAERHGARVAIVEVPPGPPVLQTLVAEIYGPDTAARERLASKVRDVFRATPGVVDVDWYVEAAHPKLRFVVDKEKAALHGISPSAVAETLRIATTGAPAGLLHLPLEREDVVVMLDVRDAEVATAGELAALRLRAADGAVVPLGELVRPIVVEEDRSIYHKNLIPVVYVTGDVAGGAESPVYAISAMNQALAGLDASAYGGRPGPIEIFNAAMPKDDARPSIKWDGEWQITLEVFRDLGLAFGVVMILIYALLVGWFRSFTTPLVVMAAIPFSLVGILPAHAAAGAFFTATSMIGFMAGAGIVVRNSIILVDFIEQRLREGMPLAEAVVDAGAVRFRPMLLTALAVVAGSAVILADPIFQGLAISLLAGEIASLLISRMAVPVLYSMRGRWLPGLRRLGKLADDGAPPPAS
jgi:multidrug efflux pump subunit AcrB